MAERSKSERDKKQKEMEAAESEQQEMSLLDDPAQPEQASAVRGWVYFAVVVVGSLALNLLVAIAGGQ
jgi:cytochrome c-type biogenesis protein CcmH/NrfG